MASLAKSAIKSSVYLPSALVGTQGSRENNTGSLHGSKHASQVVGAPCLVEEVVPLENHNLGALFGHLVGGRQPDGPPADDNNIKHFSRHWCRVSGVLIMRDARLSPGLLHTC